MTRTLRSAAVATLAALAAVAAIIAADFTPPVQAQSEDETTGRIVARRLANGRVEFGWQTPSGARVLPKSRYFPAPADATVDRWLRSSPVEVGGVELGRINARQRSDGRIEFAFTPTGGERILPPARNFPADATVGRWLRSTEITFAPPASRYIAVSTGFPYACGLRASGAITCWGSGSLTYAAAPAGSFTAIAVGSQHTCAIRERDHAIECWGDNRAAKLISENADGTLTYRSVPGGQTDAPAGAFRAVSAGGSHTCGLRESGAIECWGYNDEGQTNAPSGNFRAVSAGWSYNCAIRASNGEIECWGRDRYGETNAPVGSYTAVSVGGVHTCAIRTSGEITCWGSNFGERTDAPDGAFRAVSAGGVHTCAIRESGEITCWGGWNSNGELDAPAGSFTAISTEGDYTCAIRESGEITCWGGDDHEYGRTDVPPG